MNRAFNMKKIIAFLFAVIGAALNAFQPVIDIPISGSTFTISMYGAFNAIMTGGLPSEGGTVLAILIFAILCLVPVIAAIMGLLILFSERKSIGIILFLCAIANALVAWVIYHASYYTFTSSFFTNYVVPYAQKVSFIAPVLWAVCYLVAGVFIMLQTIIEEIDNSKPVSERGLECQSVIFGIGWADKKKAVCDLDASAFLFTNENDKRVTAENMIYYNHRVHKSGSVWVTKDERTGNDVAQVKNSNDDLEQIIILLKEVPEDISKIEFCVTINNSCFKDTPCFKDTQGAYARLVADAEVDEENMTDKDLVVEKMNGEKINGTELTDACFNLKDKQFSDKNVLIVAEIHRDKNSPSVWRYNPIKEAMAGGFDALCKKYGIIVRR